MVQNMPIPKVPIGVQVVADAADEYGVPRADLVSTLEEVYSYLADTAQGIHTRTITELGEEALIFEGVHFEVIYVDPNEWEELRERLALSDEQWRAAKTSHANEANRIIETIDRLESVDELATNDKFIMPTPIVGNLNNAGLSLRQAGIQALRMTGDSQERIGEKMGIATGTVKSHCDRIDKKIQHAEELIDLVETNSV